MSEKVFKEIFIDESGLEYQAYRLGYMDGRIDYMKGQMDDTKSELKELSNRHKRDDAVTKHEDHVPWL